MTKKQQKEEMPQYTEQEHQDMIAKFYKTDKPSHTFIDQELRMKKHYNPITEILEKEDKKQEFQESMHSKRIKDHFKNNHTIIINPSLVDNQWLMENFEERIPWLIRQAIKDRNKIPKRM